jgi:hypothetical protein
MTYNDKEKVELLRQTFDLNYKVTQLYAAYLEHFPELITPSIVEELCKDGRISKRDALIALLCEAFGLDTENPDDRKIIKDYIRPSVKLLDIKKYTENKYYKNIKVKNVSDGKWELKEECYAPYRAFICGDIKIGSDFSEVAPLGFFSESFRFPAVLEDGNEWMTLTPVDLDTSEDAIKAAHGKVVTFGLGLGYYTYMVSEKENVESITAVERSEEVIRLFKKHILPQFSKPEKVNIICADAFEYAEKLMPAEKYDYAFVDIWRDASDGSEMYERMKPFERFNPETVFSYWIENFIVSRLRSLKFEELYNKIKANSQDAPESYNELTGELKKYGRNI